MSKETPPPSALFYPPGSLLIWSLVIMELFTFGVALIVFVYSGRQEPEVFHAGRAQLQPMYGAINTVFLLVSGFFMATAVERFKRGAQARPFVLLAMVGGCLFLILKGIEYNGKIQHGLTLGHDTFFTYYWLLTAFHMIHVVVGLVILAVVSFRLRPQSQTMDTEGFEACALFWHMCDLIWLILFPVIYLLP